MVLRPGEPVDLAGLGLCYPIRTRVVAVRPDSPAAKAGIKPGDVINALARPKDVKTGRRSSRGFGACSTRINQNRSSSRMDLIVGLRCSSAFSICPFEKSS